jgi:hypothetical protein
MWVSVLVRRSHADRNYRGSDKVEEIPERHLIVDVLGTVMRKNQHIGRKATASAFSESPPAPRRNIASQ